MRRDGDYFVLPGRIDWLLLARQKRWLLEHARASEEAAGLVELLRRGPAEADDAVEDTDAQEAVDLEGSLA